MSDLDFFARLQAASNDERNWLVTERLLNTLPADLRAMAWAAAVPHWFDAEILAAALPLDVPLIGETEIGLVDERRGLQRVAGPLASHVGRGELPQFSLHGFDQTPIVFGRSKS